MEELVSKSLGTKQRNGTVCHGNQKSIFQEKKEINSLNAAKR